MHGHMNVKKKGTFSCRPTNRPTDRPTNRPTNMPSKVGPVLSLATVCPNFIRDIWSYNSQYSAKQRIQRTDCYPHWCVRQQKLALWPICHTPSLSHSWTVPVGLGPPLWSFSITRYSCGGVICPKQRPLPDNIKHSKQTLYSNDRASLNSK